MFTETLQGHFDTLDSIFKKLDDARLSLSPTKSKIFRAEVLWYLSSAAASILISSIQPLTNLTELKRILGSVGWFRPFISQYARIAAPLSVLS
jgi:hypothetical protein